MYPSRVSMVMGVYTSLVHHGKYMADQKSYAHDLSLCSFPSGDHLSLLLFFRLGFQNQIGSEILPRDSLSSSYRGP